MIRTLNVIGLSAIAAIATTTMAPSTVIAAPPTPPNERFYVLDGECDTSGPVGDLTPAFTCFSCFNIPPQTDEGAVARLLSSVVTDAPTIPTSAPTISTSAPTQFLALFIPKSIYTHCFLDTGSVYSIYYTDKDCQGSIIFDDIQDAECPNCSGCAGYGSCGNEDCPERCCGTPLECAFCDNGYVCSQFGEQCDGCPGCDNPSPYCDNCVNELVCEEAGGACNGCPGCSKPPGPCDYCTDQSVCSDDPAACNNGACPICNSTDSGGSPPKLRVLENTKIFKEKHFPKFEKPQIPYYKRGRNLVNIDPVEGFQVIARRNSAVQDTSFEILIGSLFMNSTCSDDSLIIEYPLMSRTCQDIPEEADNDTLAIYVECTYASQVNARVIGYKSMQDCRDDNNQITFYDDVHEGTCIAAPTNKWGLSVQCTGWGKIPPTPSPPVPGPNDVAFGARLKYPDRRCVQGTGQVVSGNIAPCDKCIILPFGGNAVVNCTTGEINFYDAYNCLGESVSSSLLEKCTGLGPIRGIYNFEKIYRPPNSVAFFSAHFGLDGCWADNLSLFGGLESGVCSEIRPSEESRKVSPTYVKVNCTTRFVEVFGDKRCSGSPKYSTTFTDNSCVPVPDSTAFVRASCDGYEAPLLAPPTKSPTTATPTKAPAPTTATPTKAPTAPTAPTVATTKSPTRSPTKSSAMANFEASFISQLFAVGIVALVANQ